MESKLYIVGLRQYCGSGFAWIRIHFPSWIRIRIQYADPDPGGKNLRGKQKIAKKTEENFNKKVLKTKCGQNPL